MSLPVDLDALQERVSEYGELAFLVTVNEGGTPHVVSVILSYDDGSLRAQIGRRTRRNLERDPKLTLLWPHGPDEAYCMIVDATAVDLRSGVEEITVVPEYAVLHRVAGATGDGPGCQPLADPDAKTQSAI